MAGSSSNWAKGCDWAQSDPGFPKVLISTHGWSLVSRAGSSRPKLTSGRKFAKFPKLLANVE